MSHSLLMCSLARFQISLAGAHPVQTRPPSLIAAIIKVLVAGERMLQVPARSRFARPLAFVVARLLEHQKVPLPPKSFPAGSTAPSVQKHASLFID